ncbi:MAG: hypothetical protein IJN15_00255 [Clostridia bacterium]|nr:hypothetical protein [Clostridia bacterium]
MNKNFYNPNLTFGSIPTTCFRNERPGFFHSGTKPKDNDNRLEAFMRCLFKTVRNDRFTFMYNGKPVMAHPKWIRDHVHELKAFKHWEKDLKAYFEVMCEKQREDGQFYEMVQLPTNGHWFVVNDTNRIKDEKNNIVFVRVELEADIEYLMVEGVYQVYQATGDKQWLKELLPALEKGINYMTSDPRRYSKEMGLCIRPFTIDTWDFVFNIKEENPKDDRNIYPGVTPMSMMHGDNSGIYQAMNQLAFLNREFGEEDKAKDWEQRAEVIKNNLNKIAWNGDFYTHQVHINHEGAPNEDETKRLSFSNTYDINRKITTFEQANKIIAEYQRRRETSGFFAEWFTINPPYPRFRGTHHSANEYVNGCIASLGAGELCKAAFNNGNEEYGWDILSRLIELFEKDGELFFLYDAYTGENRGGGPSGWGASAILSAIEEGLMGIVDKGVKFDKMVYQPRVAVSSEKFGKYITGYEISDTFIESSWQLDEDAAHYRLSTPSKEIDCHILIEKGKTPKKIVCNDKEIEFKTVILNDSLYVDFKVNNSIGEEFYEDSAQKEYYFEISY